MAIGNEELMQEYFPKHSRMGTARTKWDKEAEECKKRGASMGIRKADTKKKIPTAYHYLIYIKY